MSPLLVFFDLESTGLDVDEDEIVQIAAVANTEESEEFSVFVVPSVAISQGASNVHGITTCETRQGRQLARRGRILPSTDMETGLKFDFPLLMSVCVRYVQHFYEVWSANGRQLLAADTLPWSGPGWQTMDSE